jgi:hypothetical protein
MQEKNPVVLIVNWLEELFSLDLARVLGAVHMSRAASCHEMFFLTVKDNLNELYIVTGIKLSYIQLCNVVLDVYQSCDKSFIKLIIPEAKPPDRSRE